MKDQDKKNRREIQEILHVGKSDPREASKKAKKFLQDRKAEKAEKTGK